MAAPEKRATSRQPSPRQAPSRRSGGRRDGLGGSMSSDPKVHAGERERDAIPHTGREGFGDGQELSHSKGPRR